MLAVPLSHACGSLGQDLERVPRCFHHHAEDSLDELVGYSLVEEVAHRVYEDHSGSSPLERGLQPLRPEPQIEPLFVGMSGYSPPSLGEGFRVAMFAAGRHL